MTRTEIELYAMKRGLTARQAERFAENTLNGNSRPSYRSDLDPLLGAFVMAAGITLGTVAVVDDLLLNAPSAILGGVAEVGLDIASGFLSIFD